jgi:hypothetical protein
VHVRVPAAEREVLCVRAALDAAAVVQDVNAVRPVRRAEAVADNDYAAIFGEFAGVLEGLPIAHAQFLAIDKPLAEQRVAAS